MINMNGRQNEYWRASPLRPKSGSNIAKLLLHMRFLFLPFTPFQGLNHCVYEDTCKDEDSDAYKCVYVIVLSWQKGKSTLLSHRKRRRTHIAQLCCLCFNSLKSVVLKLQFLKTCDHASDAVPRLGMSSWFCPGWSFCLLVAPHGGWRIKIAVTSIMKMYYPKQCILRHYEINDRT